ncbi:NTF2-related export protein 2-like isoform X2 [Ostrea edulis]|uniref:NTF2-related export protein 2-like isoform X2 n=1 Tax=Ostrea edulis TaxID=37623 RepID=UPI0020941498|nr:NTF2-related export protein 2-like isoform X2 [Ostrea edulis]
MPPTEDLAAKIDQATEAGEQFAKLYYETYDKKRHVLHKLYLDTATMVWNGNGLSGLDNIQKYLEGLPVSEHRMESLDCQPLSDWTYYGMVSGPSGQDTDETVNSRILQLGTFDHNDERKMPILFQDKVSGGQFSIIVKTYGTVKYQNRKPKTFHQNFMLTSQNNLWKVVSDSFRFQD